MLIQVLNADHAVLFKLLQLRPRHPAHSHESGIDSSRQDSNRT